jgi:hypothetical protein
MTDRAAAHSGLPVARGIASTLPTGGMQSMACTYADELLAQNMRVH